MSQLTLLATRALKVIQLVFMNIHMPDTDGTTAAFKFLLPLLPLYLYIIVITGDGDKRKRYIELGMVHFIEQPVGISESETL